MTLGFLSGSKNFLQASLGFLWSFCFARIRLDPLGGQVLHHDCISMTVSRFSTFTENFVIFCYQVTKIFCTRYGSAIPSSARGPCNFGLLADLAISVFRWMSINTVLTDIRTPRRICRWSMRRTGVWVPWLESVLEVDVSDLDDEFDKPGTTIWMKFSVLHCLRIPFLMRCGFWPLVHS